MNNAASPVLPASALADPTDSPLLPLVREFFPELGERTIGQLGELARSILAWNTRLNLISRKDAAHIEEHHILHALTLTRVLRPLAGARFADLGTGGGFPGLVLAICYPQCRFTLVDSVGKKIAAVGEIARELGLHNVVARAQRAETLSEKFDYVTGRAVTALPTFLGWARPLLKTPAPRGDASARAAESRTAPQSPTTGSATSPRDAHAAVSPAVGRANAAALAPAPNGGIYYFKGTLWREELAGAPAQPASVWPLDTWIPRPFFTEKFLLHFAQ